MQLADVPKLTTQPDPPMPSEIALVRVGLSAERVRAVACRLGFQPAPQPVKAAKRREEHKAIPWKEWVDNVAKDQGVTATAIYTRIYRGTMKPPRFIKSGKYKFVIV